MTILLGQVGLRTSVGSWRDGSVEVMVLAEDLDLIPCGGLECYL